MQNKHSMCGILAHACWSDSVIIKELVKMSLLLCFVKESRHRDGENREKLECSELFTRMIFSPDLLQKSLVKNCQSLTIMVWSSNAGVESLT